MRHLCCLCLLALLPMVGCSKPSPTPSDEDALDTSPEEVDGDDSNDLEQGTDAAAGRYADITDVDISGEPGAYTFSVTIESPDTGCEQYADWWEVVSSDGELIYRRILAHSHVDEQPFTRSGGPVDIQADDNVYVRAHMNTSGYGGQVAWISPNGALEFIDMTDEWDARLEDAAPQPNDCAF